MSVILRNEYGAVGVNKSVIEKMILEELLELKDCVLLCNKKGKIIKEKRTPWIDPDNYDAIDVNEKRGEIRVTLYMVIKEGHNISEIADRLFDYTEELFELLRLSRPRSISVKVKGIMSETFIKRNIEVVRRNA